MSYFNKSHNIRNPSQENPKATELSLDMKKLAVQTEIDKVRMLPSNSSYAQHRSRVLVKLLHLMNIQVSDNDFHLGSIHKYI